MTGSRDDVVTAHSVNWFRLLCINEKECWCARPGRDHRDRCGNEDPRESDDQTDRSGISDLVNRSINSREVAAIQFCVAFVGINFAERYVSFEGEKWPTDGKKYKHPIQEAAQAEQRLKDKAQSAFNEFQILQFRATNAKPFPFEWVDLARTEMEYSSVQLASHENMTGGLLDA